MSPFQHFRFWLRRAPVSERTAVAVAVILVVGLLGWLLAPAPGGDDELATTAEVVAGPAVGVDGAVPTTVTPGVDAAPGQPGSAAPAPDTPTNDVGAPASPQPGASEDATVAPGDAAQTASGCVSPPGSAPGVSTTEIKIAVALTNVFGPAANELFGVPQPEEQRALYDAVIAAINKDGGVACRRLVPEYHNVNPADQSAMQQQCIDISSSGVYALIDTGAFAGVGSVPVNCFGQRKLPYFGAYFLTRDQTQDFYPYLFTFYTFERLYRDTALGLRDVGFFDPANGFRKLGFVYQSCRARAIDLFVRSLHDAGLSRDQIVEYDLGCSTGFASPSDIQQAVLTFRRNGVTHVTTAGAVGDFATFTKVAEQQGFRPKYGLPDEALLSISGGSQAPDPDNIVDAIAVTLSRNAENNTPGMTPTAGTQRCDAILTAAGHSPAYEEASLAGNACSQLWMFEAAVENAPSLDQTALAAGLQRAKSVDFSYPQAPNDFSGDRVTTGGQFWRTAQFRSSCQCWQVLQPEFRPAFP